MHRTIKSTSTNYLIKILTTMEELVKQINELTAAFAKDAEAQILKGNKAAGLRARKEALEISKLMKDFRAASNAASKA